jgi:hypothetical protein
MNDELAQALEARRARAAKVAAADIEAVQLRILSRAIAHGWIDPDAELAHESPPDTVIEPWSEPNNTSDMSAGEAFVKFNTDPSAQAAIRRRAASEEL